MRHFVKNTFGIIPFLSIFKVTLIFKPSYYKIVVLYKFGIRWLYLA
jgi:hypothetical protein